MTQGHLCRNLQGYALPNVRQIEVGFHIESLPHIMIMQPSASSLSCAAQVHTAIMSTVL
jgi:hypothetical protein